jgi:ABC-type lipoprotein release transport system permease subunit/ABC-type Zn uptake system ZnuABC Zn-binding protein ZnuA
LNLPFYIARRYLFAKKSHNAINIISMISVCSVAVATVALVCVLSVFNGFSGLVASMFGNFDPELKITPATGKVFDPDAPPVKQIREIPEVVLCTEVLQDNVLVRYGDRQDIAVVKGVSPSFREMVKIDTLLIDGRFVLQEGDICYTVLGIGLASKLGVNAGFVSPLEIYAPVRDSKVDMANPLKSFQVEYAFIGGVFCINQPEYDENYMILPIDLARTLLHYETEVSALEVKLAPQAGLKAVQKQIRTLLGDGFRVQDRYEQQEASYKMMQIEKWMTFLILAFVLTIALFNVVSSLSMLMIEKQEDVQMLRSMGADDRLIRRIFLLEGGMIPALGALAGIGIGVLLCLIQQEFGIIKLGNTLGVFMSDNYPVRIEVSDLLVIFSTVFLIGLLTSWYPVRYLGKKWLKKGRMGLLLLPVLLGSCSGSQPKEQCVAVTIEPQRYFAEKIAGDRFSVFTVVPVGQSPETYDPAPHEMVRIARSKAYLLIGRIGFEQVWMETIRENNPQLTFFDLSEGVQWVKSEESEDADEHDEHEAAHDGEHGRHHHHHDGVDPHIWNSTRGARIIARNTLQAFVSLDPANETGYRANYRQLLQEIDETERTLHELLDTLTHRAFIIYHPALTYFADEFHLTQLAIEAEGKDPSAASLKELVDRARAAQVQVVFVQQEFDRKHAEQVAAEIGARVTVINPLDVHWREQMVALAKNLARQ